jgi:hypothetical protein
MRRLLFLALVVPLSLSPSQTGCLHGPPLRASQVSSDEFGRLIQYLSEESGFFWSNNYISNETSYLHVLDQLERLQVRGGVYLGVGPNQNFTYIAHIRPQLAFIVDIRRQNMLEHLLFKALMEKAETRQQFLSFLTGRPIHGPPMPREGSIEELVGSIEKAAPDVTFFEARLEEALFSLRSRTEIGLSSGDLKEVERIYRQFFLQGLEIKYDSWRAFFFPTLKEFILETDLQGRRRNWLATHEGYQFVRDMQRTNRIIPAVGDFAGGQALRRLGEELHRRGETVSAFYVSNVEFYLFRQRKWLNFVDNVRQLPIDRRSVFIRAYANLHRPHPHMVGDHITVTLVQNMERFLHNVDQGRYRDLWDVVTLE